MERLGQIYVQVLLRHKRPGRRAEAAQALGLLPDHDDGVVDALTKALGDEHRVVKAAAAEALGRIGPAAKGAVQALTGMLTQRFPHIRGLAVRALGRIGPAAVDAVPALTAALSQSMDWNFISDAAWALVKIGPSEATEVANVVAGLLRDKDVPWDAREALEQCLKK